MPVTPRLNTGVRMSPRLLSPGRKGRQEVAPGRGRGTPWVQSPRGLGAGFLPGEGGAAQGCWTSNLRGEGELPAPARGASWQCPERQPWTGPSPASTVPGELGLCSLSGRTVWMGRPAGGSPSAPAATRWERAGQAPSCSPPAAGNNTGPAHWGSLTAQLAPPHPIPQCLGSFQTLWPQGLWTCCVLGTPCMWLTPLGVTAVGPSLRAGELGPSGPEQESLGPSEG